MKRALDVQFCFNPWLSLGGHIDHKDPSITIHLPLVVIYFGNCKQPGFRKEKNPNWFNDFLVRCRLKQRVGQITKMEYENTSYLCVPNINKTNNHICVQGIVKEIKYVYNWLWPPFQKVTSAKKRKVPFEKHTNPACQKEIDLKNTVGR